MSDSEKPRPEHEQDLLERLHEVRSQPGGIFVDLLRCRPVPLPAIDTESDDWLRRRRDALLSAAEEMVRDAEPGTYPEELLRYIQAARSEPDGLLESLVEQIQAPSPFESDADLVARRLQRLRRIYAAACEDYRRRHRSIVYPAIAAGLLRLRRQGSRIRAKIADIATGVNNAAAIASNTFAAAALATTLVAGASMEAAAVMPSDAQPSITLAQRDLVSSVSKPILTSQQILSSRASVERGLHLTAPVPGQKNPPSARVGGTREGRRFVIKDDLNGWLAPVPYYPGGSGTLYWINCEDWTLGKVICSVVEPTWAQLPPPPKQ